MDSKTLSMIRKYCDQEDLPDDDGDENSYANDNYLPSSNETNKTYPSIFSNPLIQTSFTLYSNLKRIILRKENLTLIHYLFKWHTVLTSSSLTTNNNHYQFNTLMTNKNIIEKVLNDPIPNQENYADQNEEEEFDYNHDNNDNDKDENNAEIQKANANKGIALITAILKSKLKLIMQLFHSKAYLTITRKKLSTSQLTLLYIFTELAIFKTKESKLLQSKKEAIANQSSSASSFHIAEGITQQLKDKVYELEKLNKKYENILDEKSQIIIKKNDEIESLNEKIEELSQSSQKRNNLNIIHESLCSRCGNSLEESFIAESVSESKKVIHEQLVYIEKMQKEISELKVKNNINEVKLKDLDEIKREFKILTETFQKEKIDEEVQTDTLTLSQPPNNTTPKVTGKGGKKKQRPKTGNTIITSNKKKITNYNIINIKNAGNSLVSISGSSLSSNIPFGESNNQLSNTSSTMIPVEIKDSLQSLRFDNSVLSNELLTLNKELSHCRTENKMLSERISKWEKEKAEILSKLKAKSETYHKIKKENEDLMLLIQSSKNKSLITLETENKKLKSDLSVIQTENESLKKAQMKNDKHLNEQETQIDKMRKMLESFNTFKTQKENMILENTKMQSEIKRLRYDLEESKNSIENQNVIINTKDKEITKLNEDITYYSFNARKSKQDADRALQDAVAYQKIVRKMEKELAEAQIRNCNMK